jgi:hypothetical protein
VSPVHLELPVYLALLDHPGQKGLPVDQDQRDLMAKE